MKETYALETSYRTTLAGPLVCTRSGRIVMINAGPVFPQAETLALVRMEVRTSDNQARSWSSAQTILQGSPQLGAPLPYALVELPEGRLLAIFGMFLHYSPDHDAQKCNLQAYSIFSDDQGRSWSPPQLIPTGEHYLSSVLSCALLRNGRLLFPFGFLTGTQGKFVVSAMYSDDQGETWSRSASVLDTGGCGFESGACEPSVAELPDGRLWMLIRTQTGKLWQSFSHDSGETWTPPSPSALPSSNAPAVLHRLRSGNIAVVWNNVTFLAYARHSLVLAATHDAVHFTGVRELAHTSYPITSLDTYWGVMYPYLTETADATILAAYNLGDWNYNQVKIAAVTPAWLQERCVHEDFSEGPSAWCTLGSSNHVVGATSEIAPADDEKPGAMLLLDNGGNDRVGAARNFPLMRQGRIRIKIIVRKPEVSLVWHESFPKPCADDDAVLRLRVAGGGDIYLSAGQPSVQQADLAGGGAAYSYTAYRPEKEIKYPATITPHQACIIDIHCRLDQRAIDIQVNSGPAVTLATGGVLGLCYFSASAPSEGSIALREIDWIIMAPETMPPTGSQSDSV